MHRSSSRRAVPERRRQPGWRLSLTTWMAGTARTATRERMLRQRWRRWLRPWARWSRAPTCVMPLRWRSRRSFGEESGTAASPWERSLTRGGVRWPMPPTSPRSYCAECSPHRSLPPPLPLSGRTRSLRCWGERYANWRTWGRPCQRPKRCSPVSPPRPRSASWRQPTKPRDASIPVVPSSL